MTATPTRGAGAVWRPGDPVGDRRFVDLGDLRLERGGVLPGVRLAYETWGTLSPSGDNAVLVEHALTGDSHVVGEAGPGHPTPGWWPGLVGPGAPLDTDRLFVVAANVLGGCQGSTGPSSDAPDGRPWGGRFPFLTIRDQVAAEAALADALGIRRWHLVLGGSMGGMRTLEWATSEPERVERALVLAASAAASADQVAWCQPQLLAIRHDPDYQGGDYYGTGRAPLTGLGIARRIAHTTYRHEEELDDRFGRRPRVGEDPLGGGGRYDIESYLDHHATKLARRFDANSYLVLSEAMNSHDVGRGRGGVDAALRAYPGVLHVAGVRTDRLYPLRLSEEIARARPGTGLSVIESAHGHDGFLVELDQVGRVVQEVLSATVPSRCGTVG
ncbi:homoserine O-acetyltransferase [Phycicoccus endophyticus]|uniref:Homoserine O-acetyltransferase n=1 Tax=Phycicoccus endophyticus TaxID=1690220 RepID=A0A7G9R558_9MICO|nr:homoserine O-acetyltransferase [Phycicoccus endophyticus]NHI20665.1 homoserine O-acetyltransferase [Phycicoccus endophyticus]QNN50733.1 homoserine O-acetyltransferase [Phycicoccus endophyticus]GGL43578.1 homoserine O-acetyltransferase [Phycicoccus endophyticus]